jgi:hypothetical protein
MSSVTQSGVKAHDDTCNKSLGQLQNNIAGVTSQASINAFYVTHYKNCLASALTNGVPSEAFRTALRQLGQQI